MEPCRRSPKLKPASVSLLECVLMLERETAGAMRKEEVDQGSPSLRERRPPPYTNCGFYSIEYR